MSTFISEPGTRLGGRYRLEDRIRDSGGWSAWKAIDETLARPVAVLTFAPGFPRIQEVVTAARAASRMTDTRLAQVFDVEETWDQAYVVMEWVSGDSLDDLLAEGPLEPGRGAEILIEGAAAISSAHAAGLAHLCLTPGSLRWSQSGGVKITGIAIDAALTGATADDPVEADTRGLGQLLYAALTAHWPGPDWPGLAAAPEADGRPLSPRQVCAGVPAALDEITCEAMFGDARRGSPPMSSPGTLAEALAEVAPAPMAPPPAPPPMPTTGYDGTGGFPTAAGYGSGGYGGHGTDSYGMGGYGAGYGTAGFDSGYGGGGYPQAAGPDGGGRTAGYWDGPGRPGQPGRGPVMPRRPGPGRPKTTWAALGVVGLVVIAVIALAVRSLGGHGGNSGAGAGAGGSHSGSPSNAAASTLTPLSAHGFDALSTPSDDPGNENDDMAAKAIDGNLKTAWQTQYYLGSPVFGGTKSGTGLILDMGSAVRLSSVQVTFGNVPGANARIELGNSSTRAPGTLQSFTTVASADDVSGTHTFQVSSSATGQYLLIWFTKLPPRSASSHSQYQGDIFNIVVRGSK
ncbi:MAG TPA: protein kinase family protein [Streptosporangiaceae bacterium]|nr:protein kinase family protein [Streptosporangiaceae bacterium]